jgi:hypothetical protein
MTSGVDAGRLVGSAIFFANPPPNPQPEKGSNIMSSSKPTLKVAPPPLPRSPEREELAKAIKARNDTWTKVKRAHDALPRAKQMIVTAGDRVEAAAEAVAQAKEARRIALAVAAVESRTPEPDRTLAEARAEEAAAQDELEAATAALAEVEATVARFEAELQRTAHVVTALVDRVMAAASITHLLANARATQDKLIGQRAALRHLLASGFVTDAEDQRAIVALLTEPLPNCPAYTNAAGQRWPSDLIPPIGEAWGKHAAVAAYTTARAALLDDADAPLPQAD